ncbi:MAG: head maturation protease, ClpP-related [Alphaproteobacteria bacterium]
MRNKFQAGSPIPIKAATGETEILVFGDIGESFWDDSGITAKSIKTQLDEAPSGDTIVVRINSPGGDAFEGVAIGNVLRDDSRRIVVKVDGTAISSASIIAMAGDEIRMADNALMMIHNPWTSVAGDANDMRSMADRLDKVGAALAQTYVSRTGKSRDEVAAMMDAETWLSAEEALEAGFATHIDGANDGAEALLTERKIAAYGNVPGAVDRWMRATPVQVAAALDMSVTVPGIPTFDIAFGGNTADGVILPKTSPPADTERGGNTQEDNTVDLKEMQAALTTMTEANAEVNARADALETQNMKLVEERDGALAKLAEIADAALVAKVEAFVDHKFTQPELEDQLALARKDEPLFDKLVAQRTDLTILAKDPIGAGDDSPEPSPVTGADGTGLTTLVNAAASN